MTETTVILECDTCGVRRQAQVGDTVDELRTRLTGVGWRCDSVNDLDLCPSCLAAGLPDGLNR